MATECFLLSSAEEQKNPLKRSFHKATLQTWMKQNFLVMSSPGRLSRTQSTALASEPCPGVICSKGAAFSVGQEVSGPLDESFLLRSHGINACSVSQAGTGNNIQNSTESLLRRESSSKCVLFTDRKWHLRWKTHFRPVFRCLSFELPCDMKKDALIISLSCSSKQGPEWPSVNALILLESRDLCADAPLGHRELLTTGLPGSRDRCLRGLNLLAQFTCKTSLQET